MQFIVTFKTPDAVEDTIKQIVEEQFDSENGDEEEIYEKREELQEKMTEFASGYVNYGEVISIAFDMEKQTATAIKVRR